MATILVIDDRPANREFLVTLLGYKGHRLVEAGDGAEGLARARAEHPDAVITDILMPTMDGYEFVRRLRAEPAVAGIPVIFASAHYLQHEARALAQSCGVQHILTKPMEPETVLAVLDAALAGVAPVSVTPPDEDFDREHLRLITDKLSQKAEQLRSANGRLSALIELGQELAVGWDPMHILEGLCRAAREIIGASFAAVGVLDDTGRQLRFFLTSGVDPETAARLGSPLAGHSVLDTLSREHRSIRLSGSAKDLAQAGVSAWAPLASSLLAAAIVSPKKHYGWLCLTNKLGGEFSEEDERLAVILAGQVGRIYEHGHLHTNLRRHSERLKAEVADHKRTAEQLHRHARRLETLREIDRGILAQDAVEDLARAVLARIRDLVPCDLAAVVFFDLVRRTALRLTLDTDMREIVDATTLSLDEFSPPEVFVQQPSRYVEDIAALQTRPPILDRLARAGMRSVISESLLAHGELLGALNLSSASAAAFTPEHREIVREVGAQLAMAIQQASLRQRLQQHAAELEQLVAQRTAKLEAVNKELESFSHSVSHDLRAPLRRIEGFIQILSNDYAASLDPKGQRYLERIQSSTQRMGQLIEGLLVLSRVTREEMIGGEVNLSDLAESISVDLQKTAPHRKAAFVIAPGLVAQGDARLLRDALENLLGNAWKYTSKHPVARIELGTCERGGEAAYFVRDDGAGFDMAYVEKLFRAFQRLHNESEFEGTGIGLATVQRIIHRHGGRIWAEGAPEHGATFYFTLGPPPPAP